MQRSPVDEARFRVTIQNEEAKFVQGLSASGSHARYNWPSDPSAHEAILKTSMLLRTLACLCVASASLAHSGLAQSVKTSGASPVLTAAKTELDRDFEELKKQPIAPYFLSYEITDSNTARVSSTFGALVHSSSNHRRVAHIDVRVGDYALDNTHQVRGRAAGLGALGGVSLVVVPVEDDPLPIRAALWLETDKRYKRALTQLAAVQTYASEERTFLLLSICDELCL